jgi:hypothetical protein
MWLLSFVHAATPWECPTFATAEAAEAYRGTDIDAASVLTALELVAVTQWDDSCAWVETEVREPDHGSLERVCDQGDLHVVYTETWDDTDIYPQTSTMEIDASSGSESWSSIHVSSISLTWLDISSSSDRSSSWEASWVGAIPDLPSDSWLRRTTAESVGSGTTFVAIGVETETCTFAWEKDRNPLRLEESVVTNPGAEVRVTTRDWQCDEISATVDGVSVGAVLPDTWALDPADTDRDGVIATCDCDDTDPGRAYPVTEVPDDGIDQDCDGADLAARPTDSPPADTPASCATTTTFCVVGLFAPLLRRRRKSTDPRAG